MIIHNSQTPRRVNSRTTAGIILLAVAFCLAACCKDDPGPGPGPGPEPPEPPTPPVPEANVRVPLSLEARPEGNDAPLWQADDTLHVILTGTNGSQALGDTAFYRYICASVAGEPFRFSPATVRDTAFLPADSSKVDLLVYRPALIALDRPTLRLTVDAPQLTALGYPLMTAARRQGLHVLEPAASVTLSHRLARLSVGLTLGDGTKKKTVRAESDALEGAQIILHGNSASAVWSLPDEAFISYGDTVSQYFRMRSDGTSGYLYTIPSPTSQPGDDTPPLFLTVRVPGRQPFEIPLDKYLPPEGLNTGISVNITIEIPKEPDDPDTPDEPDDPDNPDNPDGPDDPDDPTPPTPPDPNIVRITVTLTDWENIIYDSDLYPD